MVQIIQYPPPVCSVEEQIFISHMVQIILFAKRISLWRGLQLYIPHGSDNTEILFELYDDTDAFISHMVQIILCGVLSTTTLAQDFISHMVQIIRIKMEQLNGNFYLLYIPHGSDNTLLLPLPLPTALALYIPHGSDNTKKTDSTRGVCFKLYIPHGSDNTYYFSWNR